MTEGRERKHQWRLAWPGNFCLACGIDDPHEECVALDPDCQCVKDPPGTCKVKVPPCGTIQPSSDD